MLVCARPAKMLSKLIADAFWPATKYAAHGYSVADETGTPMTVQGSVIPSSTFSTTQPSISYNGVSSYVYTATSVSTNISDGQPFTVEWLATTNSLFALQSLGGQWRQGSSNSLRVDISTTGQIIVYWGVTSGTTAVYTGTAGQIVAGVPFHLAVSRTGTNMFVFLNGALVTTINVGSATLDSSGRSVFCGCVNGSGGSPMNFWCGTVLQMRVTRVARYTAAFTPLTAPFPTTSATDPNWSSVWMLLQSGGGNVQDVCATPNTFTFAAVGIYTPLVNSALYFNGSTTSGMYSTNSFDNLCDGRDFTIEIAFFPTYANGTQTLLGSWNQNSTANDGWIITLGSGGGVNFIWGPYSTTNAIVSTSSLVTYNAWNFIVWQRQGNIMTMWVNGVAAGNVNISALANKTVAVPLSLGNYFNGASLGATGINWYQGYMDEIKITRRARYASSFTVPSTAFLVDSNTMNLFHFDTDTTDATGKVVTTTSAPTIQSTNVKVGAGAASFAAGNQIQETAAQQPGIGGGDFTTEAWVYFPSALPAGTIASGTTGQIAGTMTSGDTLGNTTAWWAVIAEQNALLFAINVGSANYVVTRGPAPWALNTWYHVAVVRQSGYINLFINGQYIGANSQVAAGINNNARPLNIGGFGASATQVPIILDEVRISSSARYGVTVPTTPSSDFLDGWTADYYWDSVFFANRFAVNADLANDVRGNALTLGNTVSLSSSNAWPGASSEGSMLLDGTVNGTASVPNTGAKFQLGNKYTIEGLVYLTANSVTAYGSVIAACLDTGTAAIGWALMANRTTSGPYGIYFTQGSGNLGYSTNLALNTWYHVAVVRNGANLSILLNGVVVASSTTFAGTDTSTASSNPIMTMGYFNFSGVGVTGRLTGQLKNVRITKAPRWGGGNYTPAKSSLSFGPYAVDLYAKFINQRWDFVGGVARNEIDNTVGTMDSSTSVVSDATFGNVMSTTSTSSTGLTLATSFPAFAAGEDYTIEAWVNLATLPTGTVANNINMILGMWQATSANQGWFIGANSDGTVAVIWSTTGTYTAANTAASVAALTANTWGHIAVCRRNGVVTVYVNGKGGTSVSDSNVAYYASTLALSTSRQGTPLTNVQKIANIQITRNACKYSGDFTPSQSLLPLA